MSDVPARFAARQVRLGHEQGVDRRVHRGVVVEVGSVDREIRRVGQTARSGHEGRVQAGGQCIRALGFKRCSAASCRATPWLTMWTPNGVTVGDDDRPGLDPWREESIASPA